jgi:hypothetical protein
MVIATRQGIITAMDRQDIREMREMQEMQEIGIENLQIRESDPAPRRNGRTA